MIEFEIQNSRVHRPWAPRPPLFGRGRWGGLKTVSPSVWGQRPALPSDRIHLCNLAWLDARYHGNKACVPLQAIHLFSLSKSSAKIYFCQVSTEILILEIATCHWSRSPYPVSQFVCSIFLKKYINWRNFIWVLYK